MVIYKKDSYGDVESLLAEKIGKEMYVMFLESVQIISNYYLGNTEIVERSKYRKFV